MAVSMLAKCPLNALLLAVDLLVKRKTTSKVKLGKKILSWWGLEIKTKKTKVTIFNKQEAQSQSSNFTFKTQKLIWLINTII